MAASLSLPLLPAALLAAFLAAICSLYVYLVVRRVAPGFLRLFVSAPVMLFYAAVPRLVDQSENTVMCAVLFCSLTWLSSFRILGLCFQRGVLVEPFANRNFLCFHVALAVPIHFRTDAIRPLVFRSSFSEKNDYFPRSIFIWLYETATSASWRSLICCSASKLTLLALFCHLYDYIVGSHPVLHTLFFAVNLYLFASFLCEALAALAQALLDMPADSAFKKPYLSSSLEDFWARRWNLLISCLLRDTIFKPVLALLTWEEPLKDVTSHLGNGTSEVDTKKLVSNNGGEVFGGNAKNLIRRSGVKEKVTPGDSVAMAAKVRAPLWARLVAMIATFFVSGVMHELAVWYLSDKVTGEMTAFFTLHGFATASELVVKRTMKGKVVLPRLFTSFLTLTILFLTGKWLFFGALLSTGIDRLALANTRRILGV